MKKLIIISLSAFLMLFVWGCSEQTEITEPELGFTKVELPNHLKSTLKSSVEVDIVEMEIEALTPEGKTIFGKMRLTIPDSKEETLVDLEITNNIFQETDLTTDFLINSDKAGRLKSSCIASCQETFTNKDGTKIKGRGACKAQCWANTVIAAAAVLVAALAL